MNRDSFVFYRSFYEAIKNQDDKTISNLFKAICEYALNHNEIELNGIEDLAFQLIKPQLEANFKKALNGYKGGIAKGKQTEANGKQKIAKPKQKIANGKQNEANVNVNVNDNVNVNVNTLVDDPELADAISRWLDARTAIGPYPYASITACIDTAKQNKSKFGTGACVRAINAAIEGGWKKIVWPDEKARSGTTKDHGFKQNEYDFDTLEKQLLGD